MNEIVDVEIKIKKVMDHLEIYVNNEFIQTCDFWERCRVIEEIKNKMCEKDFGKCLLFKTIMI